MWSSWYPSEPGPSTVMNRMQADFIIVSRNSCGTLRSVSAIVRPSASLIARISSALARPCSDSFAPATRLRPRHSNESKLSSSLTRLPSPSASEAMSVRIQSAIADAIEQRSVAAGLTGTRLRSASTTASSRTRSSPPHAPGPMMAGTLGAMATASVNARRQAEGAVGISDIVGAVSLACLPSCPAGASAAGRGCGNGILVAADTAAGNITTAANTTMANRSRPNPVQGRMRRVIPALNLFMLPPCKATITDAGRGSGGIFECTA